MSPPSFIQGLSFHLLKRTGSVSNLKADTPKYLQDKLHGEERETMKKNHGFQYKQYETAIYNGSISGITVFKKTFETWHVMKPLNEYSALHKFQEEV